MSELRGSPDLDTFVKLRRVTKNYGICQTPMLCLHSKTNPLTKGKQMLTLQEIVEYKLAESLEVSKKFEAVGMTDSADQWGLVADVLARILSDAKEAN